MKKTSSPKPEANPSKPTSSKTIGVVFGLVALAVVGIAVFVMLPAPNGAPREGGGNDAGSDAVNEQLALTRRALAETENLELVAANANWDALYEQLPGDPSVAMNRALNRVLRVQSLAAQATNAALDAEEKKQARAQLPDAISAARQGIQAFAKVSEDPITPQWLATDVDLHEASLLPASMTRSIRREVFGRLTKTIQSELGSNPECMVLGGELAEVVDQMEDPIDGLPANTLAEAASAFASLSNHHPDNLFFALKAARLNIENKDQQAAGLINRSQELTSAIEPLIRNDIRSIGVTPDEFVEQMVNAIESNDWQTAENKNLLWFNVLNSSEIMKTDRRRAMPHVLDRLNFDSLRALSAKEVERSPIDQSDSTFLFEPTPLPDTSGSRLVQTIDYDLDLDADLVVVNDEGTVQLWENGSNGSSDASDTTSLIEWTAAGELKLDIVPSGVLVADLFLVDSSVPGRLKNDRLSKDSGERISGSRHDTFLHLIAYGDDGVRVISVDGRETSTPTSRLELVEKDLGLSELSGVTASIAGDLEADGDLDLVFSTTSEGVRVFVNRGNRTFFELVNVDDQYASGDPVSGFAIADLDRDLDLDIVTTHSGSGRVGILENLLHLQFRGRIIDEIPAIVGASSVAIEEIDGNVSWDLIVGGTESSAIVFSHTADAGAWVVDHVETSDQDGRDLVVADLDNDSWMEAIANGQVSRMGPWGWSDWTPIDAIENAIDLAVSDFNRDGGIDLVTTSGRDALILQNQTDARGHYLDVRFKGIDDNASGRVNHYAIGSVLETRFGPHYRARIVTSPSTHFGIDGIDQASSVRAILPNGLTQTTADPPIDSLVEEQQTLKGSCPYLYAWDGEKFVFMTDCLWAAPLGLQVARGVVAKDRPWEYLKIDGASIQPKEGQYEFRITEELWEVAYFDEVELTAVDHPIGVDVWTNEKVGPGNIATPTVFAFAPEDRYPVQKALDTSGTEVTDQLAVVDQNFVQGFDRRLRQGLCPPHWIDLDFGDKLKGISTNIGNGNGAVYLVLTGWIMPTDASLNIQIDQNPELQAIEFPSVWVPDSKSDSGWTNAIPFMGFPGGKTKTIVVDVTEIMNQDDPRFRVRTSAQIYWDSAEVVVQTEPTEIRQQVCELVSANVGFHGFSKRIKNGPRQPEVYDYQDASQSARWPPLRGKLSVEGDCLELLQQWDDRMVVISSGDEIQMRFTAPLEEPPEGWVRDFVLHSVGWDKDADLNTLTGQQIGPLPYKGMTEYPPTTQQQLKSEAVDQLNMDHLGRSQSFRSFWHREPKPPLMRFHH